METTNTYSIESKIQNILDARKKRLPDIQKAYDAVSSQRSSLTSLVELLDSLKTIAKDEEIVDEIFHANEALEKLLESFTKYASSLNELKLEFERDTLNIGVSGAARTGKSTTLQRMTGLTNQQIPSGGLNPTTAVRSEIYNSPKNTASVYFRTEEAFVRDYIQVHTANINSCLSKAKQVYIDSVAQLQSVELPNELRDATAEATDSLKRLCEAQASVASYKALLGSPEKIISLDEIKEYVTYPSPEDESNHVAPNRLYLAVDLVQIFCPFPNLGNAKVGLVDLPGLGEIGASAESIHLKGLESKVDQIFLVMHPTDKNAFANAEIARNLDELHDIQPAVERGQLIVTGINKDERYGDKPVDNLRRQFDAEINKGRGDDVYEIIDYCAVDDQSVASMFSRLLDRLAENLPSMDKKKLEYCAQNANTEANTNSTMDGIVSSMDKILRSIPSSDKVAKERIDEIERSVIGKMEAHATTLAQNEDSKSEVFERFLTEATAIHDSIEERIESGLFRGSTEEWTKLTSNSKDYYNLYRDECKRIRFEIIDSYSKLDSFYGQHIHNFKLKVLVDFLESFGLNRFFEDRGMPNTLNEKIERVKSELGSTLHDDDLYNALSLLQSVNFDFKSNVFLQIEKHLANLANPSEELDYYGRASTEKHDILGGSRPAKEKQEKLQDYLIEDAKSANNAIIEALESEQDQFNKYLSVCLDFFCNYLYGKDEDNFKQVVIRGMIREYKKYVLPDADDASKSPAGQQAEKIKELAIRIQKRQSAVMQRGGASVNTSENQINLKVNRIVEGEVNRVDEDRAYVTIGDRFGVISQNQINNEQVSDVRKHLKKGQKVCVKIIGMPADVTAPLKLSLKDIL